MKKIFPSFYEIPKKNVSAFIRHVKNNSNSPLIYKSVVFLKENYSNFNIDKRTFYESVYENNHFDENKLRQLLFRINNEFKNYLLLLNTTPVDKEFNLFIKQHHMGDNHNKLKTLNKLILNKDQQNIYTQSKIAFLESYQLMYESQYIDRSKDRYFQEANNSLDLYFIIEKLKLVSATIMHGKVFKIKYELGIYDSFDDILKRSWDQLDKNIQLLYYAIKMTLNDDIISYKNIKENRDILTLFYCDENKQIVTMLINFCIQKINSGDKDWLHEVFDWYKFQIDNNYLIEKGQYLNDATYKNIISTSILLKEIKWAKDFCSTYYNHLNPISSVDQYHYNLARIYYESKNYNKVLELLSLSDPQDTLINISIKVLLIKTWYALDEYDLLNSHIESFKIYLYRHKNMGYHYTMNSNFIKILSQILKANSSSKSTKKILAKKIEQLQYVSEKKWLISILN